ncbi:MAG: class I SAM-dependent methyltransferase [Treponema sp.]|nr:class I SAM-dependent methyltransferase [Treponema sp.]
MKEDKDIETIVGDITNLKNIENANFDIVMVLGHMYHLSSENRGFAFDEAKRICKMNGVLS